MFYKIEYVVYDNYAKQNFTLSRFVYFSRKLYVQEEKDFTQLLDCVWDEEGKTLSKEMVQSALDQFHKRHPNVRGVIATDPFDTITIRKEVN